ncbi:hypothetical protein ACJX0J_006238, partial [Zea mays]
GTPSFRALGNLGSQLTPIKEIIFTIKIKRKKYKKLIVQVKCHIHLHFFASQTYVFHKDEVEFGEHWHTTHINDRKMRLKLGQSIITNRDLVLLFFLVLTGVRGDLRSGITYHNKYMKQHCIGDSEEQQIYIKTFQ